MICSSKFQRQDKQVNTLQDKIVCHQLNIWATSKTQHEIVYLGCLVKWWGREAWDIDNRKLFHLSVFKDIYLFLKTSIRF